MHERGQKDRETDAPRVAPAFAAGVSGNRAARQSRGLRAARTAKREARAPVVLRVFDVSPTISAIHCGEPEGSPDWDSNPVLSAATMADFFFPHKRGFQRIFRFSWPKLPKPAVSGNKWKVWGLQTSIPLRIASRQPAGLAALGLSCHGFAPAGNGGRAGF